MTRFLECAVLGEELPAPGQKRLVAGAGAKKRCGLPELEPHARLERPWIKQVVNTLVCSCEAGKCRKQGSLAMQRVCQTGLRR